MNDTNTSFQTVFDSFESSFQDKCIIPEALELVWLKKAIAEYGVQITPLSFDESNMEFVGALDEYVISTLAQRMKVYYLERETSKVNKRVSIVSKDVSVNSGGHDKTAVREETTRNDSVLNYMYAYQKETAYV